METIDDLSDEAKDVVTTNICALAISIGILLDKIRNRLTPEEKAVCMKELERWGMKLVSSASTAMVMGRDGAETLTRLLKTAQKSPYLSHLIGETVKSYQATRICK